MDFYSVCVRARGNTRRTFVPENPLNSVLNEEVKKHDANRDLLVAFDDDFVAQQKFWDSNKNNGRRMALKLTTGQTGIVHISDDLILNSI